MLGSHNSFTYLPPKNWWRIIFAPWAKCQSKDIAQQVRSGVRYFDIRCRYVNGEFYVSHGPYIVNLKVRDAIALIDSSANCNIYRLILEYNKQPKNHTEIEDKFRKLVQKYSNSDTELDCAIIKYSWWYVKGSRFTFCDYYSSVKIPKWKQIFITPKLWRKKHKELPQYNEDVLLTDFV